MTELRTTNMATVTLRGSGGFGGAVTLAGSVVNAQNAQIPGWTVAFNNTNVTVPADGSVDVVATLTIPSDNRVPGAGAAPKIDGVLKIDATSSLGAKTITTPVSALNQVSLNVTMNGGLCVYSAVTGLTKVTVGTKVRMVNKGTDPMIFHSDGNATIGLPHQNTATTTAVNVSYDNTILTAGANFGWYCHSPGPNPNNNGIAVGISTVAPL